MATPRERLSTSHVARNPLKLSEIERDDEDFLSIFKNPPAVGAVGIHVDPESLGTLFGGYTAITFQGVTTLITPAGPFRMEGARLHLLSQVFSFLEDVRTDLHKERLLQETMDKDPNCRSFAWKILLQAKLAVGATTYIGDTALTAPPIFDNVVRGDLTTWVSKSLGPRVIHWTSLSCEDQATILPKSKAFRKRQWWFTGNDELAAYDRKVEIWISRKHKIPKNLLDDLESLLNSAQPKMSHTMELQESRVYTGRTRKRA